MKGVTLPRNATEVFFLMVDHPLDGWTRVGPPRRTKSEAQGWLAFVKAAWNGQRTRVACCSLRRGKDGRLTAATVRRLSLRFSCDVGGKVS